jgi:hypothetical protein
LPREPRSSGSRWEFAVAVALELLRFIGSEGMHPWLPLQKLKAMLERMK